MGADAVTGASHGAFGSPGDHDDLDGEPHGGVDVRVAEDVTAVRFWGSVDLAVRTGDTATLGDLRGSSGPVTVDCRDVTFMDSTGLSVLVRVVRDATGDGRPVRFLGASPQVTDLLRFAGVDEWMTGLGVVDGG